MPRQTRREFVRTTCVGFGSYLVVGVGACRKPAADAPVTANAVDAAVVAQPGAPTLKALTPRQLLTVSAACERILPRDEDPGAVDLGVPYYIDAQMADRDLEDWRKPLMGGLAVLDRQSKKLFGREFHEATPEQQDQLLTKWQTGASGEQRFFSVLMNLTFEGAFGDPTHGGNKDGMGFAMVGFVPGAPRPGALEHEHH